LASIADVYVTILPETGKIADGIKKALLKVDDDVRAAAKRWKKEIEAVLDGTDVDVNLKVDSTKAKAEIDKATKDQKAEIKVDADTAKANAQIDHAARNRKATINVDAKQAGMLTGAGIIQQLNAMTEAADLSSQAFKATSSSASRMGTMVVPAVAAAIPVLTSLAGVAAAAAGALALLPAAFAAVGAGAGVMMIGLSGITDAYEAVSGAAKSAGKDAADHASKVQSASRSVTSAQQSLSSAVKNETQAQKDVARARRDALHELQDINDELRNGAIDETQAQIDLAQARDELATGTFSSSLDYQQAQLNVIKAEQRLKEAHEGNIDLETEAQDKRTKGVDQADEVVAAEQRLADAQQNTANAQTALADAQTKLANANNETSTSAQKAADAMGLLAPAGQEFVTALQGLTPVWNQFKQDLQQPLLAGLGETMTNSVNALLPAITPGLQRIAGAFNQMFQQVGEWLQKPENLAMLEGIVNNIATAFEHLGPAVQPFLTAITTLVNTGSGFLPGLADGLTRAAIAFSDFITQAAASGSLDQFIQTGLDTIGKLGEIMPHVVSLFEKLVPLGVTFTPILVELVNKFLDMMGSLSSLWTILEQISPVLQFTLPLAFDVISGAVSGVVTAFTFLRDLFIFIRDLVVNVANAFKDFLGPYIDAARVIIENLWHAIENNFPIIKTLEDTFRNVWKGIRGFFDDAKNWMGTFFDWVKEKFLSWIPEPVKQLIKKVWPEWGGDEGRTVSGGGFGPAPPTGPTPAAPPGGPAPVPGAPAPVPGAPGALPAPSSTVAADGTRVFVTNWPSGGIGGGTGVPTTTAAPGTSPVTPSPGDTVLTAALKAKGFSGEQIRLIQAFSQVEGLNPAGNPNLGFTDAQLGGATDLQAHVDALVKQFKDRASVSGPFPTGGTDQAQAEWIARVVGQTGNPSDWQGNAQPQDYVQRVVAAMQAAPTTAPSPVSQSGVANTPQVTNAAGLIQGQFPGKKFDFGGSRKPGEVPGDVEIGSQHLTGLALDVGIGSDMALGDAVYAWANQNKAALGIDYILWRVKDHFNHVHISFKPGAPVPSQAQVNAGVASATPTVDVTNPTAGPGGTPTPVDSHVIPLNPNVPPGQQGSKDAKGYGKQLGTDIVSGMMEIFGIGDIFPDPTQFGLFKIFKSVMGLKPGTSRTGAPNGGPTNADSGSGGGDPFIDLLTSLVPGAGSNSIAQDLAAWQAPTGSTSVAQDLGGGMNNSNNGNFNLQINNPAAKADTPFIMDTVDTTLQSFKRNAQS
jgi:phage-related protein